MGIARRRHPLRSPVHPYVAMVAAALVGIFAPGLGHADGAVTSALAHRGEVNWSRGMLVVTGASAADVRAPTPEVARIRAERRAREQARARLLAQARTVTWAGGDTVGDQIDAAPAAAARLARAVDRARDEDVDYSSDGSVVVRLALPLEAVRLAVTGAAEPPVDAAGVTAIIVDAPDLAAPRLGLSLSAGSDAYAGPTVFYRNAADAAADPRAGDRVVSATAGKVSGGAVDVGAVDLAAWRRSQPLVIVVLGKKRGS